MDPLDPNSILTPLDTRADYHRGRKDREKGIPQSSDPEPIGHALGIITECTQRLKAAHANWRARHQQLAGEMRAIDQEVKSYDRQARLLAEHRELDLKLLRGEGDESGISEWGEAKQRLDQARIHLDDCRDAAHGRRLQAHLPPWLYFVIMAALAIVEFPINLQATNAIFTGEMRILNYALAGIVGVLLIQFAHMSGRMLKQRRVLGLSFLPSLLIWALVGLLSVAALAVVYFLRWKLLDTRGDLNQGELLFFLFLNVSIYFIGLVTAILHYDPSPDYQTAGNAYRRASARFVAVERKTRKREQQIQNRFVADRKTLVHRHDRLAGELERTRIRLLQSWDEWNAQLARAAQATSMRLSAYAAGCRDQNPNLELPRWLGKDFIEDLAKRMERDFAEEKPECD